MAGVCSICSLKKATVRGIENDYLIDGMSQSKIAQKYNLPSKDALKNHLKHHLAEKMVKSSELQEIDHGNGLLQRIDTLLERLELIFQRNFEKNHDRTALKALSEERSTIELIAKISYAMHQNKMAEMNAKRNQQMSQEPPIHILNAEEQQQLFDINVKLANYINNQEQETLELYQ